MSLLQFSLLLAETKSAAEGSLDLWWGYSFADPWFLLLLPLAILLVLYGRGRAGRERGRISVSAGRRLPASLAQALAWIPAALQIVALCLVILSLARPLRGDVQTKTETEGVDIALLVDRSSSMSETDLVPGKTRLDVVKDVVVDFAIRRMTDREGAADNIALFTFARYPSLLCPFTLDVDALRGFAEEIETVSPRNRAEDGTGIGLAVAKAVAVLRESEAKSRVVVLLTDGENNIGTILPDEAASLAAEEGIRVYSVFAARYAHDPFGRLMEVEGHVDTSELEHLAEATGGQFFHAKDRAGLERAYAKIEELERTPRLEEQHVDHYDLYPRFLLAALITYLSSWLLVSTLFRRLP